MTRRCWLHRADNMLSGRAFLHTHGFFRTFMTHTGPSSDLTFHLFKVNDWLDPTFPIMQLISTHYFIYSDIFDRL